MFQKLTRRLAYFARKATPSIVLRVSSVGAQGRRRSVCDIGVGLLAQAGNTYCAHDCAVYTDRHAAAQQQDSGSDEGRSTLIYLVLDLRRRPVCTENLDSDVVVMKSAKDRI